MTESKWSVPETEIIDAARSAINDGRGAVLATVVDVEGSAYRRPGAKMIVPKDGVGVGSITAGCLEDEMLALAREVLADGHARVETYDLTGDDSAWGLGIGCNGVIDVLIEPLGEDYRPAIEATTAGERLAVCTVLESADPDLVVGDRAYYDGDDESQGTNGDGFDAVGWPDPLAEELRGPATELAKGGRAGTFTVETSRGDVTVFVDGFSPSPELVVLGTGHDVSPVVELAKNNNFRVTVIGFRGATAVPERFPRADQVRSTSPTTIRDAHDFGEDTYVVVMTHNFVDDRLALDELLATPVSIGLMGPRKRFAEMRVAFEEEGRTFNTEELERIYTPAGLDLGSTTPYQIAHSIVAEALAVHNDRTPQHLKAREGPIHDRVEIGDVSADD